MYNFYSLECTSLINSILIAAPAFVPAAIAMGKARKNVVLSPAQKTPSTSVF